MPSFWSTEWRMTACKRCFGFRGIALGAVLAAGTALLAGCDLGPDYHSPRLELPSSYRATPMSAQAAWPSTNWWQGFNSAELNALITEAQQHNLDIAAAIARVRQADAQVRIAGAPLLPSLTGTGTAQWQQVSTSVVRSNGTVTST